MTDTPNNSLNSAEQFLNEIECELASISFEEDIDMESDLVSKSTNNSNNQTNSNNGNGNGTGHNNQNCQTNGKKNQLDDIDSRKNRNRMMQLYLTIANNENNNNNETQNDDDTKSSLPYFTIVNNNDDNHKSSLSKNNNNNKQQFLKKLDETEIANLKSIMLNTQLDEICDTSNNNNKMLVICSPINSKTNDMIDTLLAKLEKQIEYSMNNSSSVSTTNSMDFQHMTQKTKELKQRMITLQNKFAILRQKRALQRDIQNNDFTAYNVNSPTKQQQTQQQQKQKDLFRPSIKHVHFPNDNESESVSSSIVSLKQWKQHEIEKLQNKNKMMAHQHKKIHQIDGKRTSKIGQNFYKNYGKFYQLDTNDYFQKLQKYGFKNNKLHSKHNNNNKNNNNNNGKSHKKTQEIRERSASIHVQCNSKNKPAYQAETLNHTLRKMRGHPKIRTTRMPWRG